MRIDFFEPPAMKAFDDRQGILPVRVFLLHAIHGLPDPVYARSVSLRCFSGRAILGLGFAGGLQLVSRPIRTMPAVPPAICMRRIAFPGCPEEASLAIKTNSSSAVPPIRVRFSPGQPAASSCPSARAGPLILCSRCTRRPVPSPSLAVRKRAPLPPGFPIRCSAGRAGRAVERRFPREAVRGHPHIFQHLLWRGPKAFAACIIP